MADRLPLFCHINSTERLTRLCLKHIPGPLIYPPAQHPKDWHLCTKQIPGPLTLCLSSTSQTLTQLCPKQIPGTLTYDQAQHPKHWPSFVPNKFQDHSPMPKLNIPKTECGIQGSTAQHWTADKTHVSDAVRVTVVKTQLLHTDTRTDNTKSLSNFSGKCAQHLCHKNVKLWY